MTEREKLIELLNETFEEQYEKRGLLTAPHTADHLLANGVKVVTGLPEAYGHPDPVGEPGDKGCDGCIVVKALKEKYK